MNERPITEFNNMYNYSDITAEIIVSFS